MAEEVVGRIVYQVEAEVGRLLDAQRQVNARLDQMEDRFDRSARAVTNLESGMSKLASAIKLVMAATALRGLADMVQKYQEMSDRVQMATSSQTEFEHVQQRLLKTANGTYRSLAEAQELYITTAASLRSMNYTTDQAIDIQDSMSYAFVKNATSVDRANGAISAFSKSMNKGKVEADSWETIIAAIPSVIDDIATASGKTSAQIRSLGSSGKITAQQLSEGLRQSLEANSTAAAGMANNLTDASVRMKTAITAILVETEKGTGALQSFTNGIISAADALLNFGNDSQNMPKFIDAVTISATALAAVMSTKLVTALSSVVIGKVKLTAASLQQSAADRQLAKDELGAATAIQRRAVVEKEAAIIERQRAVESLASLKATNASTVATVAHADAELASIKVNLQQIQAEKALEIQRARSQITEQGRIATATRMAQLRQAETALTQQVARAESVAQNARAVAYESASARIAAANANVITTTAAARTANGALAASQARVAATSISMMGALRAVNTFLMPLGGTAGVVMMVAAGWYLYAQRQAEARKESIAFADSLPDVISKLKEMNLVQAQGVRAHTEDSIKNQEKSISSLREEIELLNRQLWERVTLATRNGNSDIDTTGITNKLAKANANLYAEEQKLASTKDARRQMDIRINQGILDQMKAARDNAQALAEAERKTTILGGSQAFLAQKLNTSTEALKSFNAESLKINWGGEAGEKLIKQAERRLALSEKEGAARARLQAQYDAEDAGITDPKAIAVLQDKYAATESNTKALKESNAESKKAESQAQRNVQVLKEYRQKAALSADSISDLSREQAIFAAKQKLTNATPQQIAQVERDAEAAWDKAAALKAQNAIPVLKENANYAQQKSQLEILKDAKDSNGVLLINQEQYNQQSEQLEANHQANLAKIRADAAVTPTQQSAALVDPVQALANENTRKLALIQQFETQKGEITQRGLELMNAANTQYEQQRIEAQWELYRNQNMTNELLASSVDALQGGATNAITGLLNGTQNLSEALANIGTTILNSVVGALVEMGMQQVKNALMGQVAATAALAATTAQATAAAAAWAPAAVSASIATMGSASTVGTTAYSTALVASKGMALAGAREHGGPVSAGSMYRVGEGGKPEIYRASTGKQYMIPGDNGKVISNKDMMGGGGVTSLNQVMNLTVNTTNGLDDATIKQLRQAWKTDTMLIIRDQSTRPKGMLQGRK
ncbi:tape measure protein [Pectobacterium zantedeschiae]|uniref:Tape measure protein N-terminal domain-containing protein n=1 Tax=Pectobacterium zantedeschiae TaxID=2034769 RepID=A0A9X8JKP9_9GAMM|nr:tape measure protein [Pectobacterium zantedeschiae]RYC44598.1 hypothetical protein CLR69_06145 [Pectobacterium zantedeschiae]RYC49756.1 hypothetical protein CTN06_01945 [Pectobacterium zantedeschiae]